MILSPCMESVSPMKRGELTSCKVPDRKQEHIIRESAGTSLRPVVTATQDRMTRYGLSPILHSTDDTNTFC